MVTLARRREVPTLYSGIFKIQVLNQKTGKWEEPDRGKVFKARRYVKDASGHLKEVRRTFESLAEARAFRGADLPQEEVQKAKPECKKLFGELVEDWKRDWLPNKDLSTQIRYKSYLRHFLFFMKIAVDDIEPVHIDRWIAQLKTPEYLANCHSTRCSYDHEASVLRIILNYYSTRYNRNYRLPFIKDHRKMLKVKNKALVKKDLTVDQFKSFIKSLHEICWSTKWEPIYHLALMQYAIYGRIQDAAALHVEDVDVQNDRLSINKKVQWLRARGYEDRIVAGSKTNGGKIFSPIPELAVRVFNEWRIRSGIRSGLLFQIDNQVITYRQIENRYSQALKKAGLPFSATHILRHAALAEAYSVCRDLLAVQELGGQKDLRSTTRYAKVRNDRVIEVQNGMNVRLSSVATKSH